MSSDSRAQDSLKCALLGTVVAAVVLTLIFSFYIFLLATMCAAMQVFNDSPFGESYATCMLPGGQMSLHVMRVVFVLVVIPVLFIALVVAYVW